jgi:hypothetical protein
MKLVSKINIRNPFTEEIFVKSNDEYVKIDSYNDILFLYERYFEIKFFVENIGIKIEIDLLWYHKNYHIVITKDEKEDYSYIIQFK